MTIKTRQNFPQAIYSARHSLLLEDLIQDVTPKFHQFFVHQCHLGFETFYFYFCHLANIIISGPNKLKGYLNKPVRMLHRI